MDAVSTFLWTIINGIRASLVSGNPRYDDIVLVSGGSSGNGQQ